MRRQRDQKARRQTTDSGGAAAAIVAGTKHMHGLGDGVAWGGPREQLATASFQGPPPSFLNTTEAPQLVDCLKNQQQESRKLYGR